MKKKIFGIFVLVSLLLLCFNNVNTTATSGGALRNIIYEQTFSAVKDTYVRKSTPDNSYNWHWSLVGGSTNNADFWWIWMQFNITKPEHYSKVLSISFSAYRNRNEEYPYNNPACFKILYSPDVSWSEYLHWNTQPTNRVVIPSTRFDPYQENLHNWVEIEPTCLPAFSNFMTAKINEGLKNANKFCFSLCLQNDTGLTNMGRKAFFARETGYAPKITVTFELQLNTQLNAQLITENFLVQRDTYIDRSRPHNVMGNKIVLKCAYWKTNYTVMNPILTFNISKLQEANKFSNIGPVIDAQLFLYELDGTGYAQEVVWLQSYNSWQESTLTWSNSPDAFRWGKGLSLGTLQTQIARGNWRVLDTADLINAINNRITVGEITFSLSAPGTFNYKNFASKENYNGAYSSFLRITYLLIIPSTPTTPESKEEIEFSPIVGSIIHGLFFWGGFFLMFASIPIMVYRIREGDEKVYAVVIGLAIFTVGMTLFFGAGGLH